jgi:hypothetical protein
MTKSDHEAEIPPMFQVFGPFWSALDYGPVALTCTDPSNMCRLPIPPMSPFRGRTPSDDCARSSILLHLQQSWRTHRRVARGPDAARGVGAMEVASAAEVATADVDADVDAGAGVGAGLRRRRNGFR